MYIALVMACLVNDPAYCKVLEDQRGPYETYERCQARAYEMSEAVHRHMRGYKSIRWKCKPVAKGQLSGRW